jgi:Ca2+-binding RTX toxin-like protein
VSRISGAIHLTSRANPTIYDIDLSPQSEGSFIISGLVYTADVTTQSNYFVKKFDQNGLLVNDYISSKLEDLDAQYVSNFKSVSDAYGNTFICYKNELSEGGISLTFQKINNGVVSWETTNLYNGFETLFIQSIAIDPNENLKIFGYKNSNGKAFNGLTPIGGDDVFIISKNGATGVTQGTTLVGSKAGDSLENASLDIDGSVFLNMTGDYNIITKGYLAFDEKLMLSDSGYEGDGYGINIMGTDTKDSLTGTAYTDTLFAKYGDDILKGFAGNDQLFGDYGNDQLYGGDGVDYLYGGYGGDRLYGDAGDDLIYGEQGDDTLYGGAGNDVIDGGSGADYMSGGKGNDTYYVNNAKDIIIDNGARLDFDTVIVTETVQLILPDNIEDAKVDPSAGKAGLTGNSFDNDLTGNDQANKLKGEDGADVLNGGGGSDSLSGGAGNDIVDAGAGSDVIIGDLGNDDIDGGVGIDTISYTAATAAISIDLTSGTATSSAGNNVAKIGIDALFDIENVVTGNFNDIIAGNTGTNTLTGGLGSDSLYGGSDKVKDIFDFNAVAESKMGTARDKVYDFASKIDKIDLSGIDANTAKTKAGDQAFLFNNTTAKANSIWYKVAEVDGKASTKDIVIYGDVDGNAKADFEIGLVGVTAIAAGDLVL